MSIVLWIVGIALLVYVGLAVGLFLLQQRFTYWPSRHVEYTPQDVGLDYREVLLDTPDGVRLHGWFVPAEAAKFTVLFCHGNGGNVSHRVDSLKIFNELGLNCLIFDYRGYGKSSGKPNEQGTYIDARTAYKWLTGTEAVKPGEIIVLGRSLGGAIAAKLASEVPLRSLVLESTFSSFSDMAQTLYWYLPVRWFTRLDYATIHYLRDVQCPVMVVHSSEDNLVPYRFGRRLFEAAPEPKKFLEIFGNHNDGFMVSRDIYMTAWADWVDILEGQSAREAARNESDTGETKQETGD
jgi:fermentation-respiration switch protein FrsA (DUF1100 family)